MNNYIPIDVPEGKSGEWEVKEFEVSERDSKFINIRAAMKGRGYVPPGKYKYLKRRGETIMSNTPDEIMDFRHFTQIAGGTVLINGLGIGVVLKALLQKPEIKEVIVIEKSADVIKLSAPTYTTDPRVTIINADAFEYTPPKGKKYDYVWHDIWDYICADNLPEMKKLHLKYSRKTKYQDSWCKRECMRQSH